MLHSHYNNNYNCDNSFPVSMHYCHWKKKVEPKGLHGGAVFMSTGWSPFRYRFSTTLQSGTVFYQKKVDKVVPFFTFFFLNRLHSRAKTAPHWSQNSSTFGKVVPFSTFFWKILENGSTSVRGTVFFSNMIIKEKMAPLFFQWYLKNKLYWTLMATGATRGHSGLSGPSACSGLNSPSHPSGQRNFLDKTVYKSSSQNKWETFWHSGGHRVHIWNTL